ncbi:MULTISPECIES: putative sugar O-methyltransferase [Parachlamydia]|jgi:hypothetical protein|nr:putative sugar O-methyltransferase [Parachlamydia acanthamoebae]EFB41784.1 hypothetical protein pah_c022o063 [Parachlamydia acanthamoebae str. Hall's coccus]
MMHKIFATFLFLFSYCSAFASENPTSVTDTSSYRDFCYLAATDDEVFQSFKREPVYRGVLEHVSYELGIEYLKIIQERYPDLLLNWDKFSTNDLIGSPIVCYYPELGNVSPSTLRYVKILGEIRSLFGDLSNKKIIEIGGGYGGQCKIISDQFAFNEYVIVDLPEPLQLTKKYLSNLGVNHVRLVPPTEIQEEECDLFISNYAFSECQRSMQAEYLEKYILKSSAGYMIHNNYREIMEPKSFSIMEIYTQLKMKGYKVRFYPEEPCTANRNILITWTK